MATAWQGGGGVISSPLDLTGEEPLVGSLSDEVQPADGFGRSNQDSEPGTVDITPSVNMINSVNDYTAALALNELVQNSIESLIVSGVMGDITIHLDTRLRSLVVEDSGPGMPPEKLSDWMVIGGRGKKVEPPEVVSATQMTQSSRAARAAAQSQDCISREDVDPPYCTGLMGRYGVGAMNAALFLAGETGSVSVSSKVAGSRAARSLTLHPHDIRQSLRWEAKWQDERVEDEDASFFKVVIKGIPPVKLAQFGSRGELQKALKATYKPYLDKVTLYLGFDQSFGEGKNLAEPDIRDVWTITEDLGDLPNSIHPLEAWFRFYRSDGSGGKKMHAGFPELLGQARLRFFYHPRNQDGETLPLETISSSSSMGSSAINDADFSKTWRVGVRWQGVILPEDSSSHGSFQTLPLMRIPQGREKLPKEDLRSQIESIMGRVRCFIDVDGGFAPEKDKKRLQMTHELKTVLESLGAVGNKTQQSDFMIADRHRVHIEIHFPPDPANLDYISGSGRMTLSNRTSDTHDTRTFIRYREDEQKALRGALLNFVCTGHTQKDHVERFRKPPGLENFPIVLASDLPPRILESLRASMDLDSNLQLISIAAEWTLGSLTFISSYPKGICMTNDETKDVSKDKGKGKVKGAGRRHTPSKLKSAVLLAGGGRRGSGAGKSRKDDQGQLFEIAFFAYSDFIGVEGEEPGWGRPQGAERDAQGNDTKATLVFLCPFEEEDSEEESGKDRPPFFVDVGKSTLTLDDKFRCMPARALLDPQKATYLDRKALDNHLAQQRKRAPSGIVAECHTNEVLGRQGGPLFQWMSKHLASEPPNIPRPQKAPEVACEDLMRELQPSPVKLENVPAIDFKVLRSDGCAGFFNDISLNVEIVRFMGDDGAWATDSEEVCFSMSLRPVETKVDGKQRGEKSTYGSYSVPNRDWIVPVLRVLDTQSNRYEMRASASMHLGNKAKPIVAWTRRFLVSYPRGLGSSWSMCVHNSACSIGRGKGKYKGQCPKLSKVLDRGLLLGEKFAPGLYISQFGANMADFIRENVRGSQPEGAALSQGLATEVSTLNENRIPVVFGSVLPRAISGSPSIVRISESAGIELGVYETEAEDGWNNKKIENLIVVDPVAVSQGKGDGLGAEGLELKLTGFKVIPAPDFRVEECGPAVRIQGMDVLIRATHCTYSGASSLPSPTLLCEIPAKLLPGPVVGLLCELCETVEPQVVERKALPREFNVTHVLHALDPLTTFAIDLAGIDAWGNPNCVDAKDEKARVRVRCDGCSVRETKGVDLVKEGDYLVIGLHADSGCAEVEIITGTVAGPWLVSFHIDGDKEAFDTAQRIHTLQTVDLSSLPTRTTTLSVFKGEIKGMCLNILAPSEAQGFTFTSSPPIFHGDRMDEADSLRVVERIATPPGTFLKNIRLELAPGEGEAPMDFPGAARIQIVPCESSAPMLDLQRSPPQPTILLAREHSGPVPDLRTPEIVGTYQLQCFAHAEGNVSAPALKRQRNNTAQLAEVMAKAVVMLEVLPGPIAKAIPSATVGVQAQRRGYTALPSNAVKVRIGKRVNLEFKLEDSYGNMITSERELSSLMLESEAFVLEEMRIQREGDSCVASFLLSADVSDGGLRTVSLCLRETDSPKDRILCAWTLMPQIGQPEHLYPYFSGVSNIAKSRVPGCTVMHVCEAGSSLPALRVAVHDESGSLCDDHICEVSLTGELRSPLDPTVRRTDAPPPFHSRSRTAQVVRGVAEFTGIRLCDGREFTNFLLEEGAIVVLTAAVKGNSSTGIRETRIEVQVQPKRANHLKFRPGSIKSLESCVPGESLAISPLGGVEIEVLSLEGSPATFKNVAADLFPLVYKLYLVLDGDRPDKYEVGEAIVVKKPAGYAQETLSQENRIENAVDYLSGELVFRAKWPLEAMPPSDCDGAELLLSRHASKVLDQPSQPSQGSQREKFVPGLVGCSYTLVSQHETITVRQRRSNVEGVGVLRMNGANMEEIPAPTTEQQYDEGEVAEVWKHLKRAQMAGEKLKNSIKNLRSQMARRGEELKTESERIREASEELSAPLSGTGLVPNGEPLKLSNGEQPIVRAMCHAHREGKHGPRWRECGVLGPALSFLSADTAPLARALSAALPQCLSTVYCWNDEAVTYMKANWKGIVEQQRSRQQGQSQRNGLGLGAMQVAPLDAAHVIHSRFRHGWDEDDPQRRLHIDIMDDLDKEGSGFLGFAVNLVRVDPIFFEPRWTLSLSKIPQGTGRKRQAVSTEPVTIRSGLLWSILQTTMVFDTTASAEQYKRRVNEASRTNQRNHGHPTLVSLDGGFISARGVETIRDETSASAQVRTTMRVEKQEAVLQAPLLPALAARARLKQEYQNLLDEQARLEGTIERMSGDIKTNEDALAAKEEDIAELRSRIPDGWVPSKRARI